MKKDTKRTLASGSYSVEGTPIPLARHRHSGDHTWDSQKQQKYGTGIQLVNQHEDRPKFQGPIQLDVTFFMPIRKSGYKAPKGGYHLIKPDLSNLIKYIEDAATKILFDDDCIISVINAQKRYSEIPRTEFTITELEQDGI